MTSHLFSSSDKRYVKEGFFSDVTEIFAKSQDPEELKQIWQEWHAVAGAKAKHNFTEYVELYNEAAKLNGK